MKKILSLVLAAALTVSLAACGQPKQPTETGKYAVYNQTGEAVTELYMFEVGKDKGKNLADGGFANGEKMDLTFEGYSEGDNKTVINLTFVTESGYEASFETLHIEEAPISLLAADALTGPTPISFTAPE